MLKRLQQGRGSNHSSVFFIDQIGVTKTEINDEPEDCFGSPSSFGQQTVGSHDGLWFPG